MLDEEREFYDTNLARWLRPHAGKHALIKGHELIGVFDSFDEALAEGARRYGLISFLARRIEAVPAGVHIPALTLGLLHAGSTQPVHGKGAKPRTEARSNSRLMQLWPHEGHASR